MPHLRIKKTASLKGTITLPGDKSISHRAVIMGSLANGTTTVRGILNSEDVKSTIDIFRHLGVNITIRGDSAIIRGRGLYGLKPPRVILDAGNSGTTARLMMGILSGQKFTSTITGDSSLKKRPMARITVPLEKMGAEIYGKRGKDRLPLTIKGANIRGITYKMPIPSSQVKSSLLLAGLFTSTPVTIIEPILSRDHTEIMFKYFGLPIKRQGNKIVLKKVTPFKGKDISVPGDISSAAFFIAAGVLIKNSRIVIKNAGINPLRTGIIKILKKIGADIVIIRHRPKGQSCGEQTGDIVIDSQPRLKPFHLKKRDIPELIDEIPILSVVATQIHGTSIIEGAEELRVKETDRLRAIAWNLQRLGADVKEMSDGLIIRGKTPLSGSLVKSFGDHRMAMSMAIAGLISSGGTKGLDTGCINISFPEFSAILNKLTVPVQPKSRLTIAIDGPAGSGKTTMAKLLAKKLGYMYMDTGAMYRAVTLKAMDKGVNLRDEKALIRLAKKTRIDFKFRPAFKIFLDGKDVSDKIRTQAVTSNVHYIAKILGVRKTMWKIQRRLGRDGGVVAEGRDIGTVVFPDADIKFYLDASNRERARRRYKDFKAMRRRVALRELEKEIIIRDRKDKGRKIAPLKMAEDSIYIDTTSLTIHGVLDAIKRHIPS